MKKTIGLSVIIPVFNEEEVLHTAYARITQVMKAWGEQYEMLFVDDGSYGRHSCRGAGAGEG